jgi:hypothetical protein
MGKPLVAIAAGAETRHLNILRWDAFFEQETVVRGYEVEGEGVHPVAERGGGISRIDTQPGTGDVLANLVALPANRRTDEGEDFVGMHAVDSGHCAQGVRDDPGDSAGPSSMNGGNDPGAGRVKEHWQTIGVRRHQRYARL